MARGVQERRIPLFVNGSLETKANPKLLRPPALLELENMFQLRTGEFRPRNGFSLLPVPERALTAGDNLFATKVGGLGTVAVGGSVGGDTNTKILKYGNNVTGREGWAWNREGTASGTNSSVSFPNVTGSVAGIPLAFDAAAAGFPNSADPDMCVAGGARHVAWTNGVDAKVYGDLRNSTDGRQLLTGANLQPTTTALRPPLTASTGGNWMALFYSSAANTLNAVAHNEVTQTTTSLAIAVDMDNASPWFDVKAIPGTNNFAVAYKVTAAGGVKVGIYNPSASTFTSVVTTAGADASFCMGFLDDSFTTGSMYLATAGSAAGVVVREMSATTMVVAQTRVIDAAATANIRNITGHLTSATPRYNVFWDVSGTSTIFDAAKIASWSGVATPGSFVFGPHSLYSRSVKFPDGKYRLLGCFASPVQAVYTLFLVDSLGSQVAVDSGVQCHILSGEASSRRSQCSLSTPVSDGASVSMAVSRARSITTPDGGKAVPSKTTAILSFSATTKITHAREMGGTVFIPGGLIYRDDGATFEPATFPIYPEAATGTSSGAGGAMTASGAYSYRCLYRCQDATGRIYRSAASVPFAITLGAGDNRVTLAVYGLTLLRQATGAGLSGFGQVIAEIYRRGPASTGATLYNKVGEVAADTSPATPTVTFIDGVSDANAALGEVAYFNGNVLENFHPPAHSLIEVNGNRVGLVNAEDPTEFWYSKEYKAGTGIGFNPLNKVAISGDGAGAMTALAAMDGRWILFKKSAIYVLSGDGPNDLGQGSFNQPQTVSRTLGTINPSSVIETPDGIMFQAQAGNFWLIDRGLALTYIGSPVEGFTNAQPVLVNGAALVSTTTTVRFTTTLASPKCQILEWDYFHKKWYVQYINTNESRIQDCANSPLFGWCVLLQSGELLKEVDNQTTDTFFGGFPIIPKISFPHVQLAGLAGYQRLRGFDITIDVLGNHTLSVDAEYDFSGAVTGTPKTIALTTATPTAQVQYTPPEGKAKCTSVRPVITISGTPAGATFRLTGVTAIVGVKRGSTATAADRLV